MQDSIFTKIIRGEVPSFRIDEDDTTFSFLDIHPIVEGHTLVVPKTQVEFVWDLEPEEYQRLMASVKKVGAHLRQATGKKYVGIKVVGMDVPHAHVHLIPFDTAEEYNRTPDFSAEPDFDVLARVHEQLKLS